MTRWQRIELCNRTERLGGLFDWSNNLVRHYNEAHNLVLERGGKRMGTLVVRLV
jgi:hypothetical protein